MCWERLWAVCWRISHSFWFRALLPITIAIYSIAAIALRLRHSPSRAISDDNPNPGAVH
jgi:hypothetical protein